MYNNIFVDDKSDYDLQGREIDYICFEKRLKEGDYYRMYENIKEINRDIQRSKERLEHASSEMKKYEDIFKETTKIDNFNKNRKKETLRKYYRATNIEEYTRHITNKKNDAQRE